MTVDGVVNGLNDANGGLLPDLKERLDALATAHGAILRDSADQLTNQRWMIFLLLLNLAVAIAWIVLKLWIDRNQEFRFRTLVEIAQGHGDQTDRSKRRIAHGAEVITDASAKAVIMARKATEEVKEAKDVLSTEVQQISKRLNALIDHLCPKGLPGFEP